MSFNHSLQRILHLPVVAEVVAEAVLALLVHQHIRGDAVYLELVAEVGCLPLMSGIISLYLTSGEVWLAM